MPKEKSYGFGVAAEKGPNAVIPAPETDDVVGKFLDEFGEGRVKPPRSRNEVRGGNDRGASGTRDVADDLIP
ncbi:MAG: hypothetical protein WC517_05125 [Patescibacteria group bacterium]